MLSKPLSFISVQISADCFSTLWELVPDFSYCQFSSSPMPHATVTGWNAVVSTEVRKLIIYHHTVQYIYHKSFTFLFVYLFVCKDLWISNAFYQADDRTMRITQVPGFSNGHCANDLFFPDGHSTKIFIHFHFHFRQDGMQFLWTHLLTDIKFTHQNYLLHHQIFLKVT